MRRNFVIVDPNATTTKNKIVMPAIKYLVSFESKDDISNLTFEQIVEKQIPIVKVLNVKSSDAKSAPKTLFYDYNDSKTKQLYLKAESGNKLAILNSSVWKDATVFKHGVCEVYDLDSDKKPAKIAGIEYVADTKTLSIPKKPQAQNVSVVGASPNNDNNNASTSNSDAETKYGAIPTKEAVEEAQEEKIKQDTYMLSLSPNVTEGEIQRGRSIKIILVNDPNSSLLKVDNDIDADTLMGKFTGIHTQTFQKVQSKSAKYYQIDKDGHFFLSDNKEFTKNVVVATKDNGFKPVDPSTIKKENPVTPVATMPAAKQTSAPAPVVASTPAAATTPAVVTPAPTSAAVTSTAPTSTAVTSAAVTSAAVTSAAVTSAAVTSAAVTSAATTNPPGTTAHTGANANPPPPPPKEQVAQDYVRGLGFPKGFVAFNGEQWQEVVINTDNTTGEIELKPHLGQNQVGDAITPPQVWQGKNNKDDKQVHFVWLTINKNNNLYLVTTDSKGKRKFNPYNVNNNTTQDKSQDQFLISNKIDKKVESAIDKLIKNFDKEKSIEKQYKRQFKNDGIKKVYEVDKNPPEGSPIKHTDTKQQKRLDEISKRFKNQKVAVANMTSEECAETIRNIDRALAKEKAALQTAKTVKDMKSKAGKDTTEVDYAISQFQKTITELEAFKALVPINGFAPASNKKIYKQQIQPIHKNAIDQAYEQVIQAQAPKSVVAGEFIVPVAHLKEYKDKLRYIYGDLDGTSNSKNPTIAVGQSESSNPLTASVVEVDAKKVSDTKNATMVVMPSTKSPSGTQVAKGAVLSILGNTIVFERTADKIEPEKKSGVFSKIFSSTDVCEVNRLKIEAAVQAFVKADELHRAQIAEGKSPADSMITLRGGAKSEMEILCKVFDAMGAKYTVVGENSYQKPTDAKKLAEYNGDSEKPDPSKLTVASINAFLKKHDMSSAKVAAKEIAEIFDLPPVLPSTQPHP